LQQLLGRQGVEFDARKFEYVGAPVKDSPVCVLTKASGVTSMEKLTGAKTPVKLGGTGPGDPTNDHPKFLKAALGLPIQLVSGYKGTADVRLASESGEVAGSCGWNWFSVKAVWAKAVESGAVVVVLQIMPKPHRDLVGVPLAVNFAKTDEARQLIQVGIHDMSALIRPFTLPPGTPKDRVAAVRKAFMDTMKDPEFLADAKKSNLEIDLVAGEELERTVAGLFKLSPPIVAKLKEVLQ
jgi:tripartite-type tricarboxylate transporter receptor subunit TctC